jgi:hypothetical protein
MLLSWRPLIRASLKGFAEVRLRKSLIIHDVPVLTSNGKRWASLPSKPMVDRDGSAMLDAKGKQRYVPVLEWDTREASDRFSATVVAAVRLAHPEGLEDTS